MGLSNSQFNELMREYDKRQLDNEYHLRKRYEKAYQMIPRLEEIDHMISSSSVQKARLLLNGDESALTSLKEEIQSLRTEKKILLKQHQLPEDYLELQYTCPDCKDTGYIGTEKCHCLKQAMVDLLYTQSHVKDMIKTENFSNFDLSYYSKGHIDELTGRSSYDSALAALRTSQQFITNFDTAHENLLFYGNSGVGKTFLSLCIAKTLMDSAHSVLYLTATQLFDIFAENTFSRKEEQTEDAYEHIFDADLLIIDDLGTEYANTFTASQLFVCINERIVRKKSTIISTNLSLENMKTIYSDRIISRINSNYRLLRMTGDDIRIQKKLLKRGGL
ncbi:MAG: ATP-binding protein [Dorea sp.]|nr:ATP-binding protein [Dorea sp.]